MNGLTLIQASAWIAVLWLFGAACDDGTEVTTRCKPGAEVACSCSNGRFGKRVCKDESLTACMCPGDGGTTGDGSIGSTGGGAGFGGSSGRGGQSSDAGDASDARYGASGFMLATGTSPLIDVFVAPQGIYVVAADSIKLVDRNAGTLQSISAPREITAAAFDGTRLAVFDKAFLKVYSNTLTETGSAALTELCVSAAFVSGNRVVCGTADDFDRVFYTFDVTTGALLATTTGVFAYQGIPMRRVPGKDDIVTVKVGTSPSDFSLYTVAATSKLSFIAESPYHGDFLATTAYAFEGEPAHHLVNEEGVRLQIYGTNCSAGQVSAQCFIKDGLLGTLRGGELFIGMEGSAQEIYGVVDPVPRATASRRCTMGCSVQRIAAVERVITSQKVYDLDLGAVIATRHDGVSNALILGFRRAGTYYANTDPYPGYRVELLSYQ